MRLPHMDGWGARLLPQERDCIEPEGSHASRNMEAEDAQELKQHLRVREIKIHLIMTEGAPDMLDAACSLDLSEKRGGRGA